MAGLIARFAFGRAWAKHTNQGFIFRTGLKFAGFLASLDFV
jgi:hypothetical protein